MTEFILQHGNTEGIPFLTYSKKDVKEKKVIFLFHRLLQSKEYELPIAYNLASEGYYVVLLDFRGHGERENSFRNSRKYNFNSLFDDVAGMVSDTRAVAGALRRERENCPELDSFGVAGVSVGGMAALVAASRMEEVSFAVSIISGANWWPLVENGSFNSFRFFSTDRPVMSPERVRGTVEKYDPYFNIDSFNGKPVLLANGAMDMAIPIKNTEPFFQRLKSNYEKKNLGERVVWHKYPNCGHEVTPWMIQDILKWLKEWGH
ncbi:MAG TPA: prolyl oligopeptidase family serine peptidase [Ruminiclostridium sp.]|nr:prolyl oligopeptidase family serine peptidase [Ruminiclostridium sp.]